MKTDLRNKISDMMDVKEENIIYGVDSSKEVTPIMVRDVIINCFHCPVFRLTYGFYNL
jgi:hypothetical protein